MIPRLNPRPLRRGLALVAALMVAGALAATTGTAPAHACVGTVGPIVHGGGGIGLDAIADNCDMY